MRPSQIAPLQSRRNGETNEFGTGGGGGGGGGSANGSAGSGGELGEPGSGVVTAASGSMNVTVKKAIE